MSLTHDRNIMRLYTIQLLSVWRRAQSAGYLVGGNGPQFDEKYGWREAYEWMRKQMSKRIAGFSGDYPVWAWVKRPDMRDPGHLQPAGTKGVLLTIEVPKRCVLISDFGAWHVVLNGGYIPRRGEKVNDISRHNKSITKSARVASWDQIFTPKLIDREISRGDVLQACIDRVYVNEVTNVKHFTARRSSLDNLSKPKHPRRVGFEKLRAAYRMGRTLWIIFNVAGMMEKNRRAGKPTVFPLWNKTASSFEHNAGVLRVSEEARKEFDKYARPVAYDHREMDKFLRTLRAAILRRHPPSVQKAFEIGFYLVQISSAIGDSLSRKDVATLEGISSDVPKLIEDVIAEKPVVDFAKRGFEQLGQGSVNDQNKYLFLQLLHAYFYSLGNTHLSSFRIREFLSGRLLPAQGTPFEEEARTLLEHN